MNFEVLKDKLRDQAIEIWGRIQETSLFMSLREKFEALNSRLQKAIVFCIVMAASLFLFSFPYSYITSSQDNLSSFNENRDLIHRLLKASKTLKEPSPLPPEISPEMLSGDISRALEEFHLVAEQTGGVQPLTEKGTNLVPDGVKQVSAQLQLKKLNLKQIVEISHSLQSLNPGVKLLGIDVRENQAASHYFDVIFKLVDFSVPHAALPVDTSPKGKGARPSKPQPEEKPEE